MSSESFKTQFRREAPALLQLAAPLVAAQITFVSWGVLDTLMAGRLGARELAAIAVGANIWTQVFIFFMGICIACSPIVAQRTGAGQEPARIGGFIRQALGAALMMGVLWTLLLRSLSGAAIDLLHLAPETAALAHGYVLAESWAGVLFCAAFVLRSSAEGLALARVVLTSGVFGLAAKFFFNRLFIERYGVVGLGWGTVFAAGALLLAYLAQYATRARLRELQVLRRELPRLEPEVLEIFRLGVPIGMILLAEVAFFGGTALLMAHFGDATMAAHQVAINFASLTFMVPLGIGMATTVRVGHAAGAGQTAEAALRGRVGMALGLCFALVSATLMTLLPTYIVGVYTKAPEVAPIAVTFLRLAAIFQLFDCLQATASGALRGLKDTRLPMFITIAAYWLIGMPASYSMAFTLGYGPNALWWGFTLGLMAAALGLSWRFQRRTAQQPL